MSCPLSAQNEESIYEAYKQKYEAMGVINIDKLLPKPQPQEPPDLTPEEENSMALKEQGDTCPSAARPYCPHRCTQDIP